MYSHLLAKELDFIRRLVGLGGPGEALKGGRREESRKGGKPKSMKTVRQILAGKYDGK